MIIGGSVVDDDHRHLPAEKRRIGYVAQEANLFPHLTVRLNISFGLQRRRRGSAHVVHLLDMLGLADLDRSLPASTFRRPTAAGGGGPGTRRQSLDRALRRTLRLLGPDSAGGGAWRHPRDPPPGGSHHHPRDSRPGRSAVDGRQRCRDQARFDRPDRPATRALRPSSRCRPRPLRGGSQSHRGHHRRRERRHPIGTPVRRGPGAGSGPAGSDGPRPARAGQALIGC